MSSKGWKSLPKSRPSRTGGKSWWFWGSCFVVDGSTSHMDDFILFGCMTTLLIAVHHGWFHLVCVQFFDLGLLPGSLFFYLPPLIFHQGCCLCLLCTTTFCCFATTLGITLGGVTRRLVSPLVVEVQKFRPDVLVNRGIGSSTTNPEIALEIFD